MKHLIEKVRITKDGWIGQALGGIVRTEVRQQGEVWRACLGERWLEASFTDPAAADDALEAALRQALEAADYWSRDDLSARTSPRAGWGRPEVPMDPLACWQTGVMDLYGALAKQTWWPSVLDQIRETRRVLINRVVYGLDADVRPINGGPNGTTP